MLFVSLALILSLWCPIDIAERTLTINQWQGKSSLPSFSLYVFSSSGYFTQNCAGVLWCQGVDEKREKNKANVSSTSSILEGLQPKQNQNMEACALKRSNCAYCVAISNNCRGIRLFGLMQWLACWETNMTFKSRLFPGWMGKLASATACSGEGWFTLSRDSGVKLNNKHRPPSNIISISRVDLQTRIQVWAALMSWGVTNMAYSWKMNVYEECWTSGWTQWHCLSCCGL